MEILERWEGMEDTTALFQDLVREEKSRSGYSKSRVTWMKTIIIVVHVDAGQ